MVKFEVLGMIQRYQEKKGDQTLQGVRLQLQEGWDVFSDTEWFYVSIPEHKDIGENIAANLELLAKQIREYYEVKH